MYIEVQFFFLYRMKKEFFLKGNNNVTLENYDHDHYNHRDDLPPRLDRAVLQDHYLSHDHLCLQNHQQSNDAP